MRVVDIKQASPAIKIDPKCDCTDVIAYFENGKNEVYEICTASFLPQYMRENNIAFLTLDCPLIIVDEIVLGTITKAIEAQGKKANL